MQRTPRVAKVQIGVLARGHQQHPDPPWGIPGKGLRCRNSPFGPDFLFHLCSHKGRNKGPEQHAEREVDAAADQDDA